MNRLFVMLSLAMALVMMPCVEAQAVTYRALLIGLGKQKDPAWAKINGDNDLVYVQKYLDARGYTDVITLKNEKATKQDIVDAFVALTERCKKGDVVYVHYSGHGQLMTDLDGDEALRSNARHAKWDESWIPYDAYMSYCANDRGEKHLSDDEVAYYLTAIRTKIGKKGEIVVVVDACHSGEATRGADEEPVRGIGLKFSIPHDGSERVPRGYQEDWLTISACQPYQLCMELKEKRVGKLTYALHTLGKRFFTMKNDALQKYLQDFINKNKGRLPQTPLVSGKR